MQFDVSRTMIAGALVAAGVFVLADFAGGNEPKEDGAAAAAKEAAFKDVSGQEVGRATLIQTRHGLLIKLALDNVPAGVHGVLVGDYRACETNLDDPKLATVHAGADGRIRADVLTDEIRIDDGFGRRAGRSLFIGLKPLEEVSTGFDERTIACATMDI